MTRGIRRRLVHHTYGTSGSDDVNLNRLVAIKDDSSGSPGATLADYTYLGLDQVVIQDLPEPDMKLDLFGGTSGTYAGLDRFDRVIDQRWFDYGSSTDVDRFKYGYDRASNRTWRENTVSKDHSTPVYLDEFYTYDGLHRLKTMDRGELNATKTGITGTPAREEDWSLDPLGNWSNFVQKTSGTTDLDQDRAVNKVNEITDFTETVGPWWITPAYDRNGNMITMPKSDAPTTSFTATYDAWNHLVKIESGSTTVATYAYDGLHRRVTKTTDSTVRHLYYSELWQVLEQRANAETAAETQFVWGDTYIDDLILRDSTTDRLYALHDAHFDIVTVADDEGAVTLRFTYQPYGESEELNGDFTPYSGANLKWEPRFTGRELDLETGLQLNRMRYLHLQIGAWTARDDIGYIDGFNLYTDHVVVRTTDPIGRKKYTPGLATCKKTATGMGASPQDVYYVPRGLFFIASIGTYANSDEDYWSRIGSGAFFKWKPNTTAEFIDGKGCCCCDKVGFLQTVATTSKYSGRGTPIKQKASWVIDGGIPYPHSTTSNPCASTNSIELTDSPNAPEFYRGVGNRLRALRQDFVTCAVCLNGIEGYTWNAWLEYGDLPGDWRINEIVVYGCVRWGHSIHWSETTSKYIYERYLNEKTVNGGPSVQINLSNVAGAAPTSDWKDAVLRRQGW